MHIQIFANGKWYTAAKINFKPTGTIGLSYLPEYLASRQVPYDSRAEFAVTVNAPVSAIESEYSRWPALFDDLLPVGKARTWWINHLGIQHLESEQINRLLLEHAVLAPIGNVRIKEAFENFPPQQTLKFEIATVAALEYDFLEFASNQGATVGGATGAHGVAPKLLLNIDNAGKVLIDPDFAGHPKQAQPYLVKFARNNRSVTDNNILKAEYAYYNVLSNLLRGSSIPTMNAKQIMLHVDPTSHQASLWLPRFDVVEADGVLHRVGIESIYSILDVSAGASCNHFNVISELLNRLDGLLTMNQEQFVTEYVIRDMLNVIFGNSDNHGRNISFIKRNGAVMYAPIYDFAPMKADPEVVTRLFKWGAPYEVGASINYPAIAHQLEQYITPQKLISELSALAVKLLNLPVQLEAAGCPEEIMQMPVMGFNYIEQRLISMGLLS
jgi:serine/threonine-protein kinase HipA